VPVFVGVRWIGGSNESGVVENLPCLLIVVAISFEMTPELLRLSIQSPNDFSLTPKQMTLNDLEQPFYAKYCFLSGIV